MAGQIALLRGINVGGHKKVPMAELRELARELGYADAVTYIQSGNLAFTTRGAPAVTATKLEEGIRDRFGFPVDVIVRTATDWMTYCRTNPLGEKAQSEPNRVFLVLSKKPRRAGGVQALLERAAAGESIEAAGDAVWIHYPQGVGKTKLESALIDRLLGSPSTARNWRTVLALRELLESGF